MFVNHHVARGSLMADWSAAWRKWCDGSPQFSRPNGRYEPPSKTGHLRDEPGWDEFMERAGAPNGRAPPAYDGPTIDMPTEPAETLL